MCMSAVGREFLYQKAGIELGDEIQPDDPIKEYFFLEFEELKQ